MTAAAQVSIYSGAFQKTAEVATASEIRRTYPLHNRGMARFTIDAADPQASALDPRAGNVVVITSPHYPWPWVGKAASMRGAPADQQIALDCRSFDSILAERYLGQDAVFGETASAAFVRAVGKAGAANAHGIEIGSVESSSARFEGAMPMASGREALDAIADVAGMEWWLTYQLSGGSLRVRANLGKARGESRYGEVTLVHGAGVSVGSWLIDGEAAAFATTVIGGQSSPIEAYADRAAARVSGGDGDIVHGFAVETAQGSTIVSRREAMVVAETLRAQGRVDSAARAAQARPRAARRFDAVALLSGGQWPSLGVGDVVRCQAPQAFLGGFDGPLRVLSAEVREEAGELALVGQILGGE